MVTSHTNNKSAYFERDINKLQSKLQKDYNFAQEMYAALCNTRWVSITDLTLIFSCTWRYSGELIANIRNKGEDYMEFYWAVSFPNQITEGVITDRIKNELRELGWVPIPWGINLNGLDRATLITLGDKF